MSTQPETQEEEKTVLQSQSKNTFRTCRKSPMCIWGNGLTALTQF